MWSWEEIVERGAKEYAKKRGMVGLLGEISHPEEAGGDIEKRGILGQCQWAPALGAAGTEGRDGTVQKA